MAVLTTIGFGAEKMAQKYTVQGRKPMNHARIAWDNQISDATVSATGSAPGFPPAAALTPQTFEGWKPAQSGDTLTLTFGNMEAGYIAIGAHTLSKCDSIVIETGVSFFGYSWTERSFKPAGGPSAIADFTGSQSFKGVSVAPDDSAIMILLPKLANAGIKITVNYSGDAPFIGNIASGSVLEMYRPIYARHEPAFLDKQSVKSVSESESGEFLGQSVIRKGRSPSMSWDNTPIGWYIKNFDPFAESAQDKPFYAAWSPGKFPADCFYGYASKITTPTNTGTLNFVSMGVDMKAHVPASPSLASPLSELDSTDLFTFTRAGEALSFLYVPFVTTPEDQIRFVTNGNLFRTKFFGALVEQGTKTFLSDAYGETVYQGFSAPEWAQSNGGATPGGMDSWLETAGIYYYEVSNTANTRVTGGVKQSFTLDATGRHTAWVYARPGNTEYLYAVLQAGTDTARVIFDVSTGDIVDEQDMTGSGFIARTWETTDGGHQCIIEINDAQGVSGSILFAPTNNPQISSAPNDETGATILLLAAQVEPGVDSQLVGADGRNDETLTMTTIPGFDPGIGTVKVTAWAHPGETIFRLGSVEVLADDSYQIKTYTASYTDDPGATEIEILPGSNGWVERVEYIPWLE